MKLRPVLVGLVILLAMPVPIHADTTFTVNSVLDEQDASPGDGLCVSTPSGQCTLRAAIMEANVLAGADTINLPAGIYILAITGQNEDAALTGDLDVASDVTITGAGAAITVIDGNRIDRVLHTIFTARVNLSDVTIQGGEPPTDVAGTNNGGGIRADGYLTIATSYVYSNTTNSAGGGVYATGTLSMENTVVFSNSATYGGAGIFSNSVLTVTNSSIYSNTTPDKGGGMWIYGQATLINSSVNGNVGNSSYGGGINNYGAVTVLSSAVSGNAGMGVFNSYGTATFVNVTVSGNTTAGIYNYFSSATLANTTVTGNYIGVGEYNGTLTLRNTIVAGNIYIDCGGPLNSEGYNLIQNTIDCTGTTTDDLIGVDPMLVSLQDNGGPTLTHMLLPGSPAIDAGNPAGCTDHLGNLLTTDQRGVARPQGSACDIGAVERVPDCGTGGLPSSLPFKLYLPLILRGGSFYCP